MSDSEEACVAEDMPESSKHSEDCQLYRFISSDGDEFTMEKAACLHSVKIGEMIREQKLGGGRVPKMEVTSEMMKLIVEWCDYHKRMPHHWDDRVGWFPLRPSAMIRWQRKYMNKCTPQQLLQLVTVADALKIGSLLHRGCEAIADTLKGQTTEQMRETWIIVDDTTEEDRKEQDEWKAQKLKELAQLEKQKFRARRSRKC